MIMLAEWQTSLIGASGVAMVTFGDSSNRGGHQSLLGDTLCLLSSVFYASYTIAIRKMLPDDACADVTTFFGFIGLLNLVGMAPVLLVLWLIGAVQLQGITARLVALAICKGRSAPCICMCGCGAHNCLMQRACCVTQSAFKSPASCHGT